MQSQLIHQAFTPDKAYWFPDNELNFHNIEDQPQLVSKTEYYLRIKQQIYLNHRYLPLHEVTSLPI